MIIKLPNANFGNNYVSQVELPVEYSARTTTILASMTRVLTYQQKVALNNFIKVCEAIPNFFNADCLFMFMPFLANDINQAFFDCASLTQKYPQTVTAANVGTYYSLNANRHVVALAIPPKMTASTVFTTGLFAAFGSDAGGTAGGTIMGAGKLTIRNIAAWMRENGNTTGKQLNFTTPARTRGVINFSGYTLSVEDKVITDVQDETVNITSTVPQTFTVATTDIHFGGTSSGFAPQPIKFAVMRRSPLTAAQTVLFNDAFVSLLAAF